MDSTLIFVFGTIINVVIIASGAAAVFFTAKNSRSTTIMVFKDEIIKTMEAKIKSLDDQIGELRTENVRLKSLVDDLMEMEDSRRRMRGPATKKTTTTNMHVIKKEE